MPLGMSAGRLLFLSTPSARRATAHVWIMRAPFFISIHALREEGDSLCSKNGVNRQISIHALREEGDLLHLHRKELLHISIHALREEGDQTAHVAG